MPPIENAESTAEERSAGGDEEISLKDALAQAFDEQLAAAEAEDAEAGDGEEAGAAEGDERAAAGGDRPRDEQGRFAAKKEGEGEGEAAAKPAEGQQAAKPAATAEKPAGEKPAGEQQQDPSQPPQHWSPQDKAIHAELAKKDPKAAQWILDRHKAMEADYTRKTMALGDFHREYSPIDDMFKPVLGRMREAGYTPQTLIKAWASVENELVSGDPARQLRIVSSIVNQYKIPVDKVIAAIGGQVAQAGAAAGAAEGEVHPALKQFMQQIRDEVRPAIEYATGARKRDALTQQEQQNANARAREQALTQITNEIETFKSATDEKGALKHPHFDEVQQEMSLLAQSIGASGGKPLSLAELYDRAVHANPSTRAKVQAAAQAAQRAQAEVEARAKAARARRAGSSVTGAPVAGQSAPARAQTTPKEVSLKDALSAAYDQHTGGG